MVETRGKCSASQINVIGRNRTRSRRRHDAGEAVRQKPRSIAACMDPGFCDQFIGLRKGLLPDY